MRTVSVRRHVFANRTFALLAVGQTCSNTGMWISLFAVSFAIKTITESDLQLGLVALVRAAPLIGFSLVGGGLADRVDRRRLLLLTQPAAAVMLAVLALAFLFGAPEGALVALLYLVTFGIGALGAFDVPAVQASVPTIVGRADLVQALGVLVLARQVSSIVAPAVAGVVIGQAGYSAVFGLAAAMYLVFIMLLRVIRWRSLPESRQRRSLAGAIAEGLRYAWSTPVVLGLLLMDFVATTFAQPSAFVIIIGRDVLNLEPAQIGVLASGFPLGAIVGGAALGLLSSRLLPTLRAIVIATVIYGMGVILLGLAPSFGVAIVALVLMGIADVVSETLRNGLLQLSVPDELRGRVSSVMLIFVRGGPNLGQFRAGAVASVVGPVASAVSGGILCVAGTLLLGAWLARRLRQSPPPFAASARDQR
ncbi:MAG: MFS transporter [Chloroflexota bacterium]|nr:MFS transporter [Dehalococcoidia bacterium]MDW8254235.1 MFS transporter [Chloroflexota bacterium]